MSDEFDTSKFDAALASMPGGQKSVTVGFNVNYAAAVHERLDLRHKQGQAKFLEVALRDAVNKKMVETAIGLEMERVQNPAGIPEAVARGIERAAIQILSNAQQLCPIDTGALAASATWQSSEGRDGTNPSNIHVGGASKSSKKV